MFCQMFPPCKSVSSPRKVIRYSCDLTPLENSSAPAGFTHLLVFAGKDFQRSSFWHSNVIFFFPTWEVPVFDAVQDFSINIFVHYYHKTSMFIKHLMGDLLNYYNVALFTWFAHLHRVTTKLKPPLALASRRFQRLMLANRLAANAFKTKTK